jgi:hypothetical protein
VVQNVLEVWHMAGPEIVSDAGGVDELIDALLASSTSFRMAQVFSLARDLLPSGFPDHEVFIGVDPDRLVGIMAFADGTAGNVVTAGQARSRELVAYHFVGEYRVSPAGSEVSIDAIRLALREFLSSGGRIPTCVTWQSADDDLAEWPEG